MQPTIISLLGKPLAGKDTVADALRNEYADLATISMGDVIREVKATGPSHRFWTLLESSIAVGDAGGIAPDEPVFICLTQLIEEELRAGKTRIVWVAGPRTEQQLQWLDAWTQNHGLREQFLHIDVPDEEVYRRLTGRTDGREDDKVPDVRLQNFRDITKPVIDRLRDEGRLVEIYGIGPKEVVGRRAIESLMLTPRDPEITLPMMARR
jgi:adenylate kinase family enzyme